MEEDKNIENHTALQHWFVLKVRFNRIVEAQNTLAKLNTECYVPMEMRAVVCKGRKVKSKMMPVLSNLIFVKSTLDSIKEICTTHKYLYYLSHKVDNQFQAMVIPNEQMEQFRKFIDGNFKGIDHERIKFTGGEKVKITSGVFRGSEATFIKVSGKLQRTLWLEMNGVSLSLPSDTALEMA